MKKTNDYLSPYYWWAKFVKTAKKLLPLMYFWAFVYVIVMLVLWASKSPECPDNSSAGFIIWTILWWGIYWWILCFITLISKRFHLPDQNWQKAYTSMRKKYDLLKKRAKQMSLALEARALQAEDYDAFVRKLKSEGRITDEEWEARIIKTKREYRQMVLDNKKKKGTE